MAYDTVVLRPGRTSSSEHRPTLLPASERSVMGQLEKSATPRGPASGVPGPSVLTDRPAGPASPNSLTLIPDMPGVSFTTMVMRYRTCTVLRGADTIGHARAVVPLATRSWPG